MHVHEQCHISKDHILLYLGLLHFWTLSIIWYSIQNTFQKLDLFQVSQWEGTFLVKSVRKNWSRDTGSLVHWLRLALSNRPNTACPPHPLTWSWRQIQLQKHSILYEILHDGQSPETSTVHQCQNHLEWTWSYDFCYSDPSHGNTNIIHSGHQRCTYSSIFNFVIL
jgi:hypothetical protein